MYSTASTPRGRSAAWRRRPLLAVMLAGLFASGVAQAFDFGHARLVSGSGQPLQADVAIVRLTPQELADLQVRVAPADAWVQAGLTPPVDLASLRVQLLPATSGGTRIARLSSDQSFNGAVADLLIDVSTASGQRQHQVSVLQQGRTPVLQPAAASRSASGAAAGAAGKPAASAGDNVLTVRKGDTLFSLAKRHASPGVSVYQMMAALYQANPQAFIDGNMNLLKAGGTLRVPDASALAALTDPQARRLFARHAQAFANRRATGSAAVADGDAAPTDRGQVSETVQGGGASASTPRDQLRLSASGDEAGAAAGRQGAGQTPSADDSAAVRKGVQESHERVTQLEDNIRNLNEALQAQGPAAQQAAAEGARAVGQTLAEAAQAVADAAAVVAGADAGAAPDAASGSGAGAGTQGAASAGMPGSLAGAGSAAADRSSTAGTAASDSTHSSSGQAKGAWLTNTMLAIITAVLALLVLIIAWLLRRANAKADERDGASGQITDDMIQEKLDRIDLDLNNPDDTDPRRGR